MTITSKEDGTYTIQCDERGIKLMRIWAQANIIVQDLRGADRKSPVYRDTQMFVALMTEILEKPNERKDAQN